MCDTTAASLFDPIGDRPAAASTAPKWTAAQLEGITATGSSLLLSAAAGSGKTAVLAARCAYLVCDAPSPCDVNELLVVTFTEAAAAEMRARIERAIREKAAGSNDPRLRKQLALVERAQVGTLHSFCSRLLRQHFHVLGLDPNFSVLNEEDGRLLRLEVARELLHERYERDSDGSFQRLVDTHADGYDEVLLSQVMRLHELLNSVVDPDVWLETAAARVAGAAGGRLETSLLGRAMVESLDEKIAALRERCRVAIDVIMGMKEFAGYVAQLQELGVTLGEWHALLHERGLDALSGAVNSLTLPRAPTVKSTVPGKEVAKGIFDSVREGVKEKGALAGPLKYSAGQWQAGLVQTLPNVRLLVELVREYGERYTAAKQAEGVLDFSDLEHYALRALRNEDGGGPSDVARLMHRQYRHVLVDEYQDINDVQDAILRLVSHECLAHCAGNLFAVGDVKQSIYRFRLAEPKRFIARADRFRRDSGAGRVIDLSNNFRSRGPLLEAVNAAFERLMTRAAADIDYDASQRLVRGAEYPDAGGGNAFSGSPIEVHLLPDKTELESDGEGEGEDTDRTDREALLAAKIVRELMDSGKQVYDRAVNGYRPIRYSDVAVLLRTAQVKATQIARVLQDEGIPAYSEGRSGLFEATEVRDVLSLLELLDNARQDVPVAAFLRSPLAALPDAEDALARVRLAYPDASVTPFCEAVARYKDEHGDELAARLRDVMGKVERWRVQARRRPIAEVLWTIYEETGFLAFAAGLAAGEQRKANLLLLHELARRFGTFHKQGLPRFMTFLRSLQADGDLGQAAVASDADDVVKILSVHKSKGLEFPVVIVPDLGKAFNLADTKGPLLADREAYLGVMAVDEVKKVRYPTLAHHLVRERLVQQTLAEELRVLYVAMTRAKEHLVLIGTAREKTVEQAKARWGNHVGALPADAVLGASNALGWVLPVAFSTSQGPGPHPFEVVRHTAEEVAGMGADVTYEEAERIAPLATLRELSPEPARDGRAEAAVARIEFRYPHEGLTGRPAALSVTGLAKGGREIGLPSDVRAISEGGGAFEANRLAVPRFFAQEAVPGGTEVGTATHVVMQHLDFSRPAAVAEQVGELVAAKRLTEGQRGLVDVGAIEWFLGTELGRLLRERWRDVRREVPVYYALPESGSESTADLTMVRGRLDLVWVTDDQVVIVDYKTDRVSQAGAADRAEFYAPQLGLYRAALEKILARPVDRSVLAFLTPRVLIDV